MNWHLNAMPYSQKYTPTHCFSCKFAGWVRSSFIVKIAKYIWSEDHRNKIIARNLGCFTPMVSAL